MTTGKTQTMLIYREPCKVPKCGVFETTIVGLCREHWNAVPVHLKVDYWEKRTAHEKALADLIISVSGIPH